MTKEFIREILYLVYWDKTEKKQKQKYLGRVDFEKVAALKTSTEKEVAEAIIEIGGGLIEMKHLKKWITRLIFEGNNDILKILFVEQ